MEPITTLNTLHIVATALLLISALVLASGVVKVRLEGDTTVQNRLLKRPLLFFWVLMAVSGDAAVQWLVAGAFERPVTGPDLGAGQQRALHPGAVQLGLAGGQAQSVASWCQRWQARLLPWR